jgi:vacuolar protein sorting-associated protein 52
MAVEDLLGKLAKLFSKPKSQTIFLINNYDMIITILKVMSSLRMHLFFF